MGRQLNTILSLSCCQAFIYRFVRSYAGTFRLHIDNEAPWRAHLADGGAILLCAWHQQFFAAIRHFRRYRCYHPGIMISRSSDGDLIAGVARRTGWRPVRGSSSRGGREAMHDVIQGIQGSRLAGHIVDGPRGPAGRVKAGVVRIAHESGAAIVPFSVAADKAWYFNSWDRFMLPKPFSRVVLRFGALMRLPETLADREFERQRQRLEDIMRPSLRGMTS